MIALKCLDVYIGSVLKEQEGDEGEVNRNIRQIMM